MTASLQTVKLYELLRTAILVLDVAPGERLTERRLESEFGASRTPVRAALARLETEGLVQREGRGWIAAPINLVEIQALAELREALETAAVRLAVKRASDAAINAVAELLELARPAPDEEASIRAGGDFHVELAQLSGNHFMADAIRGAMTRLSRTRWLEVRTSAAREQAWQEHHDILNALRDRDSDSVSRLVADHIRGTNERLLDSLTIEHHRIRGHGVSIV